MSKRQRNTNVKSDCNKNNKGSSFQNKNKSRKNGSNSRSKSFDMDDDSVITNSKSNDPSWYASNPNLLEAAANLPFPYATGSRFDIKNAGLKQTGVQDSLPGVAAFKLVPTIGPSKDQKVSPVNMAANNIYSFVRHMNSGSTNYDAPDLMIYLLAMDSCYSYYAFLTRIYGVMRTFTPLNYYKPEVLVEAMGVNYKDIEAHLPQLLFYINLYASKLSTLCIPNDMPYLTRHMWLYTGIYQDEDSDKAQLFMYTPAAFLKYHEDISEPDDVLGQLTYEYLPTKKLTYEDLVKFGNSLLEVNRASEDHNIMSGDIMKAYGGNVFRVPSITADYTVLPSCDEEVLMQMHNAFVLPVDLSSSRIVQNRETGVIESHLEIDPQGLGSNSHVSTVLTQDKVLDIHKANPTAADVMVATRLMVGFSTTVRETKPIILIDSCGSEICIGVYVYYFEQGAMNNRKLTSVLDFPYLGELNCVMGMALQSQFRQLPLQYVCYKQAPELQYRQILHGDIYNMTVVRDGELDKMHEVALLSMFGVK